MDENNTTPKKNQNIGSFRCSQGPRFVALLVILCIYSN